MKYTCADCGAVLDFGDRFVSPTAVTLDVQCFENWFRSLNLEAKMPTGTEEFSSFELPMRDGREVVWTKDYAAVAGAED